MCLRLLEAKKEKNNEYIIKIDVLLFKSLFWGYIKFYKLLFSLFTTAGSSIRETNASANVKRKD